VYTFESEVHPCETLTDERASRGADVGRTDCTNPSGQPHCLVLISAEETDALVIAFMYRRLVVNIGDTPLACAPAL
jgi:hypothetical protein